MKAWVKRVAIIWLAMAAASKAVANAPLAPPKAVSAENLAADVDLLVSRILAMHPNPFRKTPRARFDRDVSALKAALPSVTRAEGIAEIMRLVAEIDEGHTSVPPMQPKAGFHVLPIRFYLDRGRLYVTAADKRYGTLLGAQLVSIGTAPAVRALELIRPLVSGDNSFTVDSRVPAYLVVPELLQGVGVVADAARRVPMVFASGGRKIRLSVKPVAAPTELMMDFFRARYSPDWVEPSTVPMWLQHADKPYWFGFDPVTNTLFVQYNRAQSDPADPMPDFARRLRKAIDDGRPSRVVLDLRLNSGGEAFWNRPLLLALLHSDLLEQPGKLFVLIGRQTFSAGTLLAIDLEKYTKAVFIGEPTGGAIQNFGNHQPVNLPASGLTVLVATKYYQNNGPLDDRPFVLPQLAADLTAEDYLAGRDPALALAVAYQPPADALRSALTAAAADAASTIFAEFKARAVYRYLDSEPVLIAVGYDFIQAKDSARSIATMRLATTEHPDSANAFDSLGDAYRAAGQRDEAIASYRRALSIAPEWQSSMQSLKELGASAAPSGR